MAWEISLHPSEERLQSTKDLPARSVQQVKSVVTSYFPEIDWAHRNYGTCAYGDGEIEFEINGVIGTNLSPIEAFEALIQWFSR